MGGETSVRRLVDRFYDLMSELPETRELLAMHPEDLGGSRDKLFWFLSGWLGGPQLFVERFGHPKLRARHLPFVIGDAARDQWMRCMSQAIDEQIEEPILRDMLRGAFQRMADHMRNAHQHARPEDA
jgi:hemoglobin